MLVACGQSTINNQQSTTIKTHTALPKAHKYRSLLAVDGLELPVDITLERRRDTRFSITAKRVSLRMPLGVSGDAVRRQLGELQSWVDEQFRQKPALRAAFAGKTYRTGDVLTVGSRRYVLEVEVEERATHTARLVGNTISIQLSRRAGAIHQAKSIKTLLSRVVATDFYPEIAQRIHEWNRRTVNQPIKNIYLKYNFSNWGSCSSQGNVNLSTRLLFAPPEVQDYVIVHELAHLVELNHSDRFWAIVERFFPNYREQEKWLKTNRALCDF
jgi:predicted metal-dependent hydrolase